MKRKIILQKATRIEGNADIHVEIEDGEVKATRFMVQDFRGFEKFTQGMQAESVPHTVSRICGLCCTAHQVAGSKAIENALGVEVPDSVERLREIAIMAETIASHALSYFFLTLPDQLGSTNGIFDLMKDHPKVAEDAFWLRKAGNRILELVCKRAVHPTAIGIGTFNAPVNRDDLDEIQTIAAEIKNRTAEQIQILGHTLDRPDNIPFDEKQTTFLTFEENDTSQVFKTFSRTGEVIGQFKPDDFEDNMSEIRVDWSFAKLPYLTEMGFPKGIVLVGPMARLFGKSSILNDPDLKTTDLASRLSDFTTLRLDDFDTCRLLEVYTCAKKILSDLENLEPPFTADKKVDMNASGKGIGVVEAPRGILVHSYLLNQGRMEKMRLYVATQFNNAYINLILKDIAQRNIEGDSISEKGQEMLSRCVRLFDPCLTCATH